MKRLFFTMLLVNAALITKAQTSAGTIMIGGSVGFNSNTQETAGDDLKSSTFSISPSAGYFLSDNFALGLEFGFSSTKFSNDDKLTSLNVGPFARYYKFIVEEKFAFYGEAGFSFGSGKYDPDGGNEAKSSSFGLNISPGFAYFFSNKWALDFQLQGISYSSNDPNKDNDNDKQSSFTFGVSSFNPSLGFRYFIR